MYVLYQRSKYKRKKEIIKNNIMRNGKVVERNTVFDKRRAKDKAKKEKRIIESKNLLLLNENPDFVNRQRAYK